MKTGTIVLLTGCLAVMAAGGCAKHTLIPPAVDTTVYNRLAVLPFTTESIFSTVGYQIADEIVVALLENAPELDVVERTRIAALTREQDFEQGSRSTPESAIAIGEMLGVHAILTGSVSVSVGDINPTEWETRRIATGVVIARLIDAKTGKVIWAKREESEYSIVTDLYGDMSVWITDHEIVQKVVHDLAGLIARHFYPHYEHR